MVVCRICLDSLKKPVSLPCGHIFCCDCIIKTVQAIQPYTHLHLCPMCRSMYNITPVNMNVVPPNLRSFVTPSIRRVYIDETSSHGEDTSTGPSGYKEDANAEASTSRRTSSSSPSSTASSPDFLSELSRLRAENHALRNHCLMWRKRAEMHGAANLGLLNFARIVRDQASILARERDDIQKQHNVLKRKIEDDESSKCTQSGLTESFLLENPLATVTGTRNADSSRGSHPRSSREGESLCDIPSSGNSTPERPRKKVKTAQLFESS